MTLFDECIEALGDNSIILSEQETQLIFDKLEEVYPFTQWGRIDW